MVYQIFAQTLYDREIGWYTGWGISGSSPEGEVLRVEDVTEDASFAALLVAALNREKVEPVHLLDVIQDLLAEPVTLWELLRG